MFKLIYSNMRQRFTRTCVCVLAVALGVALILVSVGLSLGQITHQAARTRRVGEIMVQPTGASHFFALNSGTFDIRIANVIEKVEGVEGVTPILAKFLGDEFHLLYGVDRHSFQQVSGMLTFLRGRWFEQPDEIIVDTNYVRKRSRDLGDSVLLLGKNFTITGVYREGTAASVLLPLTTLQEMNGTPRKATMFFIRPDEDTGVEEVYQRLKARMPNYKITKTADLQDLLTSETPVFRQFISSVVGLSALISFLMILLAMYSTITERTREIGILKSLGASKSYVIQLILRESLLLCVAGVVLGFVLTSIAIHFILRAFPGMPVTIPTGWRVGAAAMAIAGGGLGALYPAVKAARFDPIKALGYE